MRKREEMNTKICMVGDSAVGKTSLIKRYVYDEFDDRYLSTLGTKISKRETIVPFPEYELDVNVKLLIFDIIGERGFRKLLREAYFQGAASLIAVCDVTRAETLEGLMDWIDSACEVTGEVPIHILANKIDLKDDIVLSEREVNQVSSDYHSPHEFTSAKSGENVEKVFHFIAKKLANRAVAHRYGD